jgi:hypothetical protein
MQSVYFALQALVLLGEEPQNQDEEAHSDQQGGKWDQRPTAHGGPRSGEYQKVDPSPHTDRNGREPDHPQQE